MSNNYSEQIFQSIDTIISQRLNEVSFDKTEICEIVSQDKDNVNKYWVSNGSLKYEAYSIDENRKYLVNQKVYVTIRQGNYDLRKLIIGSYSADETNENLYVNPFNHLVTSSTLPLPSSIWAKVNDEEYDDWDDVPSDSTKPNSVEFLTNFNYKNTQDFDYIGLDFSFNTNIVGYQGSYALRLSFWNNETNLTKDDNTLILSSKNLYGNPYNLNSSLSFQHLFPWPTRKKDDKIERIPITEITKIKLQLIQDNNFLKQQGEINVNTDTWIELTKADLKFGYDVKNIIKDELQLILKEGQNLKYTTGQTAATRNLYLDWKHFDTSNTPYIFNIHQSPNIFEYYKVYWLHYVDGLGKNADLPDEYAWNWETITNNTGLTQDIALTTLYRTDQYKAVIEYKYKNNETIYYAESTGLIFENTQVTAQPGATNNSDESLRLSLAKGDTGIYNIYGLDGRMVDTSKKNHTITAAFLDKTSWNDKKIETVIWKFPDSNSNTMILNGIQDSNNKNKATFDINSYYKPGAMNNRIWCEVKFKTGEIRRGSLTLQFGEISTAGTSYAFNIDFVGHNTCVYANSTDKVKIKATFEKVDGEVMTVPTITWSWVTSDSYKNDDDPLTSGSGIEIKGSGDEIELFYSGTTVPSENYSILQATISNYAIDNGLNSDLTAYLPIPIAYQDYNYISGATRLVYAMDNQSVSKSNDDYRLYQINDKKETIEVENTSWYITSHSSTLDGIPELREITEKIGDKEITRYTIRPVSYTSSYIPLVNINCVIGENIVWSQPILILSNAWESDEINDWNGAVEIDNEDGNIKAPFFVAGKKEKVIEDGQPKNRLTGLVIGDLEKASVASGTGIYGFYQGRPRYYLTDSGKFYVGKDNNFISFNEGFDGRSANEQLLIQTNSFILNTDKLKIDSTANNNEAVIQFSNKFELRANGTATIGGWNIEKDGLYFDGNYSTARIGLSSTGDWAIWTGYNPTTATAPFYVTKNGSLHAASGNIGGWQIDPYRISKTSSINSTANSIVSIWGIDGYYHVNNSSRAADVITVQVGDDYPFSLWKDGTLNCTKANITGTVTATEGRIADYLINGAQLIGNNVGMSGTSGQGWAFWAGSNDSGSAPFRVGHDGSLYATKANITGASSIGGWSIDGQHIYNTNPTTGYTFSLWNPAIAGGAIISCNNGSDYPFYVTRDGFLHANKAEITGTITAGSIIALNQEDGAATNIGNLSFWNHSQGTVIFSPYSSSTSNMRGMLSIGYTISSLAMGLTGASITLDANGAGRLSGTWSYTNGSSGSLSDINQKNSIKELNANFDTLFDKIEPIRYKYNKGTSNRYHLGYIAQQIEQSILDSALTEKDAALVIDIQDRDGSGNILNTSTKYLRYEEFIALNTWQIQKLKARVTELENEIKEIKQRYEI